MGTDDSRPESRTSLRSRLLLVLAGAAAIMGFALAVFHFSLDLTWLDAAYFAVTTMTTVGYGDFNLQQAPPAVKLFGMLLMFAGAAAVAALFGIITDSLLSSRLQDLLGPLLGQRKRHMQHHIVICGLGNVGYRVLEHLKALKESVVVVEWRDDNRFVASARSLGVPVIIGDIRLNATLEAAKVGDAKALVAVSDEDLTNLEAALSARSINSDIRVVMRLFDPNLAEKVCTGFQIETAFSTSALAAPAFAMAAMDDSVTGSFYAGDQLMLTVKLTIDPDSPLIGTDDRRLSDCGPLSVLVLQSSDGSTRFHPQSPFALASGDQVTVACLPEAVPRMTALARPAADRRPPRDAGDGA